MAGVFRFSFGPWNISDGADAVGPPVRERFSFEEKLGFYKELGFDGIQLHDDDAVPDLNSLSPSQIITAAKRLSGQLRNAGLTAEFVAPRLWEDPRMADGAYTSNDAKAREYAWERSKRAMDVADALGTKRIVLWFAREGTYVREAKDARVAVERLVKAINMMLDYDKEIRVLIEPMPHEPTDHAYLPTIAHAIGLATLTVDPSRVGGLIESAHAVMIGLDPSDEMAYALALGKLWSVHLNDQNGPKFDQDRSFGAINLRRAFNQVRVLDRNDYGKNGEWIGFDVQALRTQKREGSMKHLRNSRTFFLKLLDISRSIDEATIRQLVDARDYEELERYIVLQLMGLD